MRLTKLSNWLAPMYAMTARHITNRNRKPATRTNPLGFLDCISTNIHKQIMFWGAIWNQEWTTWSWSNPFQPLFFLWGDAPQQDKKMWSCGVKKVGRHLFWPASETWEAPRRVQRTSLQPAAWLVAAEEERSTRLATWRPYALPKPTSTENHGKWPPKEKQQGQQKPFWNCSGLTLLCCVQFVSESTGSCNRLMKGCDYWSCDRPNCI